MPRTPRRRAPLVSPELAKTPAGELMIDLILGRAVRIAGKSLSSILNGRFEFHTEQERQQAIERMQDHIPPATFREIMAAHKASLPSAPTG